MLSFRAIGATDARRRRIPPFFCTMKGNMMDRREFALRAAAFAFAAACGKITFAGGGNAGFERVFAKTDSPKNPPIPGGKRPSGGLDYFRLDGDPDGVLLKFPKFAGKLKNHKNPKLKLCFGNALENRDSFSLFARSAKDGRILARLNLVNLFGFEPVRFDIPLEDAGEIERYGIVVTYARMERKDAKFISKGDPVCLFAESAAEKLDAHAPHLLLYGEGFDPKAAFRKNFLSLNCILPFGWMSGCQTEGLRELAESGDAEAESALRAHLDFFLDDEKGVVFNDPLSNLCENGKFHSEEDFLPFVAITSLYPEHKAVQMFLKWAAPRMKRNAKTPAVRRFLSTEGCYTYAYPLMKIAISRGDPKLAQFALDEILARIGRLAGPDGGICQRAPANQKPGLKNWGRGAAWYMLGLVQTLRALGSSPLKNAGLQGAEKIKKALAGGAEYLARFQNPDGSWHCFVDDPATLPESSGTAGIAAAFALGAEAGLLDKSYMPRAEKALEWFMSPQNIEPDGFSKNVTQSNRIGDAFQRSGYRVIMPISSGLAAHIIAVKTRGDGKRRPA